MTGTICSKSRLRAETTSGAAVRCAKSVKSRMSTNVIVTSTCSPWRSMPSVSTCSATSGST
jgi:hypothetical protein